MNQKEPVLNTIYYLPTNPLYTENPYQSTWKFIAYNENFEPIFHLVSDHFDVNRTQVRKGNRFFESLKTKEEIEAIIEKEKEDLKELLKDKQAMIDYMISKIEYLNQQDESGYAFTLSERRLFKEKVNEIFNRDIDI